MKIMLQRLMLILCTLCLSDMTSAKTSIKESEANVQTMEQSMKQLSDEIAALEAKIQETDKAKTDINEQMKVLELMQQNLEQDIAVLEKKTKTKK